MGTEENALKGEINELVVSFFKRSEQINEEMRMTQKYFENEVAKLLVGKIIFVPERDVQMEVGFVEHAYCEASSSVLKISTKDGSNWFYMRTDMEVKIID